MIKNLKQRKFYVSFLLMIIFNKTVMPQNGMSFEKKRQYVMSNYTLVDMSLNNGLILNVYFSLKDEVIYLINEEKLKIDMFKDYLDFSNFLYFKYEFDLDLGKKYSDLQPFKAIFLRHNLCLNYFFLSNIEQYTGEYLKKFNVLFEVNISPYEEISKKDVAKIDQIMQNVINDKYDEIAKYEIPILIFIGEYFKVKHKTDWNLLHATNDFGNNFVIPYIKVNGLDLELSTKIFRYLNHPKLKHKDEKFRFDYFLDLDFIATQSVFKLKKQ